MGELKLVWDIYSSLANLTVEGERLTWTYSHSTSPVSHARASFVSDDELLVEICVKQPCSPGQPVGIKEPLKRQK